MRSVLRLLLCLLALAPVGSWASFHLWAMTEVYSNADGTVQFLELNEVSGGFGGQQFLAGHALTSSNGVTTNTYNFTTNLPGDTLGKKFLVGTTGFAALGIVTPDYVVPNGFFFGAGGTINFASVDLWSHGAMPSGNLSLNRDGSTAVATPTNFAGQTGTLPAPPSVIAFNPASIVFGGNSINTTSYPNVVTITNNHSSTVTIASVTVSGDFTLMSACAALNPAQSCDAGLYFTPTAVGVRNGTLTVTSDAPGSPHTAAVSGTGELSLVKHFYRSILNRAPEPGGQEFWEAEAARLTGLGANINEVWFVMANYFFNSPEYIAANKTNTAFLIDVYYTFFNRSPDQGGFDFWMSQMNAGLSREGVTFWFMFSPEFRSFTEGIFGNAAARPEVDMVMDLFRGILNRFPDTPAFNAFVGQLRSAQCQSPGAVYTAVNDMSYFFLFGSAEYANRARTNTQFVSDMYNAFLRRGGAASEVGFWINQLNTAAKDRNTERSDFIASPEFGARVNAVINAGCVP